VTAAAGAAWSASPRLGAHWDGAGTSFAVYSSVAEAIDLCLLRPADAGPDGTASAAGGAGEDPAGEHRVELRRDGHVWSTYVTGVGPGARYGYRVRGPHPADPAKLLVDPYATALDGAVRWGEQLLEAGRNSAGVVPHSLVTSPHFEWDGPSRPRVPWTDTVIYEAHVKGLTARHPDVPPGERGTYRGLAHPAVLEHLVALGVTTVELLPVHHAVPERHVASLGLTNYWGYNTLGFFAPHAGYAAARRPGDQVGEFKAMVRALHRAGLEVVLDVVYNHTAEGGAGGPLLSLRGLDAAAYYRLVDGQPDDHVDWSGCGNTLNVDHPATLRLVLDSLRYWASECQVDGFRFDLAATLGRDHGRFDPGAAFFDALYQDPVLSDVKLIAEPWDLGPDGYQPGRFPLGWSEWNDRYRDSLRDYWSGRPATIGRFAASLAGSAERFGDPARGPLAGVNFVTCHDGFTLADLVSYCDKHNEANGEGNRDGAGDNRSWNRGVEGPSDDPVVRSRRARDQRNLLAALLLSHGVPMLSHGDELGRSQGGNNNAYCHDDPSTWIDWEGGDAALAAFVGRLGELRRSSAVLRRRTWPTGRPLGGEAAGSEAIDLAWYTPRGVPMSEEQWLDPECSAVVAVFDGRAAETQGAQSLIVMANSSEHRVLCRVPSEAWPGAWRRVLDTAEHGPVERHRRYLPGDQVRLDPASLVVLSGAADAG
jgi:isoamylase